MVQYGGFPCSRKRVATYFTLRLLIVANPSHFNWTFCTLMLAENLEERAVQTFPLEMALGKPTNVDFQIFGRSLRNPIYRRRCAGAIQKGTKRQKDTCKNGCKEGFHWRARPNDRPAHHQINREYGQRNPLKLYDVYSQWGCDACRRRKAMYSRLPLSQAVLF